VQNDHDDFEPSLKYIVRIMGTLMKNSEVTISNLSMLSRVNHFRCSQNVRWLEKQGYVILRYSNGRKFVTLTQEGADYAKRFEGLKGK
jgi:predicted transcriptional regulator